MKIGKRWHISIPGVLGFLTSVASAIADPAVAGIIPHKVATLGVLAGAVIAAASKAIIHPGDDEPYRR